MVRSIVRERRGAPIACFHDPELDSPLQWLALPADAQVLTNNPDKDLMEKNYGERNVRDEGENQEKKIEFDNEQEFEQSGEQEPELNEDQAAVLAWTAARLLALPVEVSMLQVERPFLGPPRGKAPSRP